MTKPARSIRHDGWTEERKAAFVAALEHGGTIAAAAASVGMSRRSAYRLRARPDGAAIAAAWDNSSPPPTRDEFFAIIDRADDRDYVATAAHDGVWLRRQLRAEMRRARRRAWAAARRAKSREKPGRHAQVCDLHPAPTAKNPVVVRKCVTLAPHAARPALRVDVNA
jgi:hypothetical protein